MKNKNGIQGNIFVAFVLLTFMVVAWGIFPLAAQEKQETKAAPLTEIEQKVEELMEDGDIPGLSLVVIDGDETVYMKSFGYADVEKQIPVTPDTLFELGSTSKAFTALAALKCEADGLLNLDAPVSRYLPWFYTVYEGEKEKITIRQLLHQTGGIPAKTLSDIPESNQKNALEQTVRNLTGIQLDSKPGRTFQYATINYDVVGAVIEVVTGMSYEDYMRKNILTPLELNLTRVGIADLEPQDTGKLATGYKIGFFKARAFPSPVFRGNTPAGYIISNAKDMVKWLKLHMGLMQNDFTALAQKSHQRDQTVAPNPVSLLSYAMGWMVALDGSGAILHGGLNPNFTSQIIFNPKTKKGVVVMANSNSKYTSFIGQVVMNLLYGKDLPLRVDLDDGMDKGSSLISLFLLFFLLCVVVFLVILVLDVVKGRREFHSFTFKQVIKLVVPLFVMVPFLAAIYLLPGALADFSWKGALVWGPISFKVAVALLLISTAASYIGYFFSTLFPHKNQYLKSVPMLIILSLASGGANAVIIFLISISIFSQDKRAYLLYYFGLAAVVYVIGRKVLQTKLINITNNIIYDLRIKLVDKIFYTSYQKFEKLESGRILATLNNDTGQIGGSANIFVALISSIVTVIGAFLYLATIAFWATVVTLIMVALIAVVYYVVSQKANVYFDEARNTQDTWMQLLNGLQDGYKELSLHYNKKTSFKSDVGSICAQYRNKLIIAMVKFVNAFMIGESMLIVVLASVGFAVPVLFPQIKALTLMGFIMVLLYLIGPVTGILTSIPGIMQIRISWNRVKQFMQDIPANMSPEDMALLPANVDSVQNIKARGVFFEYESEEESEKFAVGPMDFEINKGEIVFIIGGNGSGKTTLAKLLTGLYIPAKGSITVDGRDIGNYQLGEYFSVVFGDFHLFEKLYDVDLTGKEEELDHYLKLLRLKDKVKLENGAFSTLELSGGQRKRLALLQCYLEDRPIYLFDEVAADQDPEFRKFFYRDLLKRMKERGKMVIAITHDDHYFDVADRVIKMDMGKIELIDDSSRFSVTK